MMELHLLPLLLLVLLADGKVVSLILVSPCSFHWMIQEASKLPYPRKTLLARQRAKFLECRLAKSKWRMFPTSKLKAYHRDQMKGNRDALYVAYVKWHGILSHTLKLLAYWLTINLER
jgi:hypothetical protein